MTADWPRAPSPHGGEAHQPWPHELRLTLAPYRFVWRDEPAVSAEKEATDSYTEERYRHDGSFHILSDRGEIELIDNANNPYAADPVSVVRLP
jgi:hypothetical protein